jgi:drug/metabolite transporter (DMT)-like permease
MDFSKLSMGAKLALVGGAILVINLFLPWYKIDFIVGSVSVNAFDEFLAWLGSFLAIAGAVILVLKAMGQSSVNAGQFKTEQLALLLGAAGFVLIVLQYLTESDGREFASIGMWLGILASALVTYGAFRALKDAGLDVPGMGGRGSGGGGGSGDPGM